MNYLPLTITAYLLNSMSVLIDKVILTKNIGHPLTYIFYISAFSLIALVVIPFAPYPSMETFFLTSASSLLWTAGAYLMFFALRAGLASRVIPIIGALVPVFLLIAGLTANSLTTHQALAVGVLIAGMVMLTIRDWNGTMTWQELGLEVFSAGLFAVSYLVLREAYLSGDFLTVFGWGRIVIIPLGILLLLIPWSRKIILAPQPGRRVGWLFLAGQLIGGVAEILLTYSISLANPAVVNSLQGVQYVFLLIGSMIFLGERYSLWTLLEKTAGIVLVGVGIYLLAV